MPTHDQTVTMWLLLRRRPPQPAQGPVGQRSLGIPRQTGDHQQQPAGAFSSAAVNGSALTITFDGALDAAAGSRPAGTDFAVTVGGDAASLAATNPVAVRGSTVTLTAGRGRAGTTTR